MTKTKSNLKPTAGTTRKSMAAKIGKRGAEDLGVARTAPLRFPYLIAYWPWAFYDPLWKAREVPVAREQRRLAAIMAADVVGYSRLMGRDESGTLARLKGHRSERLEPALARNGGRLVKLTGDGALAEFGSAVDALRAATEFQRSMVEANRDQPKNSRIVFRIGLRLGDLIVDGRHRGSGHSRLLPADGAGRRR